MSSIIEVSTSEDVENIIAIDLTLIPSSEKKTKSQLAKEDRAKKAAFKAKQQEILKAKEAEEFELGKARDAAEAAKKKEIATMIKKSAREHAEIEAAERRQQKELEIAEKLAAQKRANRIANNPCSSGGWIGCNCTWCKITPTSSDRMAACLDSESRMMIYGNSKGSSELQSAYLRGGINAVSKAMK
jgi:hypothetical protein